MKQNIRTKGYSLVEVLVAVAILMIAIVGPITIAAKSLQSAQYARQQNTAFFLAQEGITAVNTLRNNGALAVYIGLTDDPWEWTDDSRLNPCFTATGCGIDFHDSLLYENITDCGAAADACALQFDTSAIRAVYQTTSGLETPYTRVITLENVSADEILVESTVTWSSTLLGEEQSITLTTSLFNIYK